MNKNLIGTVLCACCLAEPLWGNEPGPKDVWKQVVRAVSGAARREAPAAGKQAAEKTGAASRAGLWNAVKEKGVYGALLERRAERAARAARFEKDLPYGLFVIIGDEGFPIGTGFVFRRLDQPNQIWAAAAAHLTKQEGQYVSVRFYTGQAWDLSARLLVRSRGSVGLHNPDMVLMSVPKKLRASLRPLELDPVPVKKGEKLASYGFHGPDIGSALIKTENRKVLEVDRWRIITSYNFGPKMGFAQGACGSPLIRDGKVVGMHLGSYFGRHSYVLDAARSTKILFDNLEGRRVFLRNVKIFGKTVLRLKIKQRVSDVEIFRNGQKVDDICITLRGEPVDYLHLEEVLPVRRGDVLRLRITTEGQEKRSFITYTVE